MSKTAQRKRSRKEFLQKYYDDGFRLGSSGKQRQYWYPDKQIQNAYYLGFTHGNKKWQLTN